MKRLAISIFAVCLCLGALAQERVIGDWTIVIERDPFTDRTLRGMGSESWDNPDYREGALLIVCDSHMGFFQALFIADDETSVLEPDIETSAMYRIDQNQPKTVTGVTFDDGTTFMFSHSDGLRLIQALASGSDFAFRIEGKYDTLTFQNEVGGFRLAYRSAGFTLANGCPGAPTLPLN